MPWLAGALAMTWLANLAEVLAQTPHPPPQRAPAFELCFVASEPGVEPPLLERPALVTAADFVDAQPVTQRKGSITFGTTYQHEVRVTVGSSAAARLRSATARAVGRRVAIVVDGQVRQQLMLRDPIGGSELAIAGNFTEAEARSLAAQWRQLAASSAR